ncbi:hypothetical protein FSP39_016332 [Pinctada imbricata]|uniref:Tubulin-specific chaperone cofactor E-like protein n=1 Tax=Pinctada imbricata TaxID=66713 RepID=A0AA88YW97_PINIB|nr:hypothetical protein FSP39_016332 [Pinctada imbricata]
MEIFHFLEQVFIGNELGLIKGVYQKWPRRSQPLLSMVEAIRNKYADDDDSEFDYIQVHSKGSIMTDSGHLFLPPILALDDCRIQTAGDQNQLLSYCNTVKELDLTKNKISDWSEVLKMLRCLPKLWFLNLTSNPLQRASWPDGNIADSFSNIKHLILNNTEVDWGIVMKLLTVFPCISELHLSLNKFSSVDIPENFPPYASLIKLHFAQNKIKEWSELNKIGRTFPNLEVFVGMESELETLQCEDDFEDYFSKLSSLNLSATKLQSWEDVDEIKNFPALKGVRLSGVPFLEEIEKKTRRQQIIARLPNIEQLNGSPIPEGEREDAERAFIRQYMDQEERPNRYYELEEKYGKLDPLANIDLRPKDVIKMKVFFFDNVQEINVNAKQTVKEFKKVLSNVVGLPTSKMILFHKQIVNGNLMDVVNLRNPNKFLWTLNLTEEDCFIVDGKDEEIRAVSSNKVQVLKDDSKGASFNIRF